MLCLSVRNTDKILVDDEIDDLDDTELVDELECNEEEVNESDDEQEEDDAENEEEKPIDEADEVDQYMFEDQDDLSSDPYNFQCWLMEPESVDIFKIQPGYTDIPEKFPNSANYVGTIDQGILPCKA